LIFMKKVKSSRFFVLLLWLLFFIANFFIIWRLWAGDWLNSSDDFMKALTVLNNAYSPYLGVILLFYWSKRKEKSPPCDLAFFLAIILSFVWNLIIFILLGQMLYGKGEFNENLELIKNLTGLFSWLVAGSIGFYFGKDTHGTANRN
jgi:hypothetical protein